MDSTGKQCYRCKLFERYYTKGIKQFNRTKLGWCCQKREIVPFDSFCERFLTRPLGKRRKRLIGICLSELLTEISQIRTIIEDEFHEHDETL